MQRSKYIASVGIGIKREMPPVLARISQPQLISRAFNTWAFKREHPSNIKQFDHVLSAASDAQTPISFVMYWGKGPRNYATEAETDALDYWGRMASRIAAVFEPGARLTLLFTDTHASLNGHTDAAMKQYFHEMRELCASRAISTCLVSDVVAGARQSYALDAFSEPSQELRNALTNSASKWYSGERDAASAALRYYALNMQERVAVGQAFAGHIFATYNSSKFRALFPPELPIFYMYSMRKGCAVKPWFYDHADVEVLTPL